MIYQCYFKEDQKDKLFNSELYKPFGLEPEVNPDIVKNCPELENSSVRLNLAEYSAFLNIYKNGVDTLDKDFWIGFTSYRQFDKSPVVFHSRKVFETCLMMSNGFGGWGFYRVTTSPSEQAELCHPNINKFIVDVLAQFRISVPPRFYQDKVALFCNYWAMDKRKFKDYIEWSWPIIQKAMTMRDHVYANTGTVLKTTSKDKWIGYFMERLFIIWYMLRDYYPANFGPICGILTDMNFIKNFSRFYRR